MFRCLLLLLCLPLGLYGQISLSIYGGANTNSIHQSNKGPLELYPRIYATLGAEAGYKITDRWSVALAAAYTTRGYGDATVAGSPAVPPTPPSTVDLKFLYADFVPKAYYYITRHFRLAGGLYIAHQSDTATLRAPNTSTWTPLPFPEIFSSWDFGLHSGFSMHYKRVYFFANYNWGLVPIASFKYTNDSGQDAGSFQLYNRAFQLGLGYTLIKPKQQPKS